MAVEAGHTKNANSLKYQPESRLTREADCVREVTLGALELLLHDLGQ